MTARSSIAPPLDAEALRAKYAAERDKRLRPDGPDQYLEPTGRFANLLEDPYTEVVEREPVHDEVTFAFIGAGWAGLTTGARLKEAGVESVRLIEAGGDVGGAWYWNRYPGAMCDTAAMVYLPLLEETGHMPSAKYTKAPENFAHAQRIATQYGLYEHALFSTGVTDLTWVPERSQWRIQTDRGDDFHAKYVATGTGPLNHPKLPGIPGIEDFTGHAFHTARWDYEYTGGSPDGDPMTNLADKRVGIIGTGATAVQCIPPLAKDSGELFVFQRTPSSVDARNNHPIDPDEYAQLGPGWQREWLLNFATLQTGGFTDVDLVKDGWTDMAKRIRDGVVEAVTAGEELNPELIARVFGEKDDEKMNEIRARVDAIVDDPETADGLKAWYRQFCKRPCFHDDYLQAYNEPGTHLVDTDGKGVERIDETGVWVGGVHYELDCIVFASGFSFGSDVTKRGGFETVGRDGVTLAEHWGEGMRTLHGIHAHGFPNLFVVGLTQGAFLISNVTSNLADSAATIAAVVAHAESIGAAEVEVTEEAEQAWVTKLDVDRPSVIGGNPDCTPGYYNNEGRPVDRQQRLNFSGDPDGPVAFFHHIDRWRTDGNFTGLEFR